MAARYEAGEQFVRVVQLLARLSTTERGLSTAELAEELEVNQRTVQRYIARLRDSAGVDIESAAGRWRLGRKARLPPLQLDRYQATLLLTALRLLHRQRQEQDPALVGTLGQLARALQVPLVTRYLERTLQHVEERPVNLQRRDLQRTAIDGFVESRAIEVDYVDGEGRESRRVLHPYFLEPALDGPQVYVFSFDVQSGAMRSFRLDRMRSARLLPQRFTVPESFDIDEVLAASWGVWQSETPERVVLRFAPEAARWVRESRWHPSASLRELPDGGVEMSLLVASETEMRPWVMRWGALVEALQPPSLRQHVAEGHRRAAALYGSAAPPRPPRRNRRQ